MPDDIDAEYDAFISRHANETPFFVPRIPTARERWENAKLVHILIAIALFGCALPVALLAVGIGFLGMLSALTGRG